VAAAAPGRVLGVGCLPPRLGERFGLRDVRGYDAVDPALLCDLLAGVASEASRSPDYARTVDIHRKPGYDPVELFVDPAITFPKLAIARRLAKKILGFRYLMDVISLDATIVKGSHGRPTDRPEDGPLFITTAPELLGDGPVHATAVKGLLLDHVFGAAEPHHRRLVA
jgi:hypothetical protein